MKMIIWYTKITFSLLGLNINLDSLGVLQIPNALCGVQHNYKQWNESYWQDQQSLNEETKESISQVRFKFELT